MKVLITGAGGFVGGALAQRLLTDPHALRVPVTQLILTDTRIDGPPSDARCLVRLGDLGRQDFVDELVEARPDVVFHLASVPGGAAEKNQPLGSAINLHAPIRLLEKLGEAERAPVVVFTSTVAVYGAPMPDQVDEHTPLRPVTSYGAHKLMTEILLSDLSRRGVVDGRCVRLPGIVARPPQAGGHVSAFMSDIIHRLAAGERFVCPVSADATCWWMSVTRCVDNLLHAAVLTPPTQRIWQMPALRFSIGQLVEELARMYGADRHHLVDYEPVEWVEAVFGRMPVLDDSASRALGLRDDDDIQSMVRRALHVPIESSTTAA